MTTLREAAQQALEALDEADTYHRNQPDQRSRRLAAMAALRAALAQQAEPVEPVREPVAWIHTDLDKPRVKFLEWSEDEPGYRGCWIKTPLYLSPPQRKPLTEKEMYAVEEEARKNFRLSQKGPRGQQITYWDGLTPWLIRAVERAHGIKE